MCLVVYNLCVYIYRVEYELHVKSAETFLDLKLNKYDWLTMIVILCYSYTAGNDYMHLLWTYLI